MSFNRYRVRTVCYGISRLVNERLEIQGNIRGLSKHNLESANQLHFGVIEGRPYGIVSYSLSPNWQPSEQKLITLDEFFKMFP